MIKKKKNINKIIEILEYNIQNTNYPKILKKEIKPINIFLELHCNSKLYEPVVDICKKFLTTLYEKKTRAK